MAKKESTNTSAKLLYRPIGLANSLISGAITGVLFKQLWKRISSDDRDDAPKAMQSDFKLGEVLLAAALQGALFAFVKALVDRGGARVFQRLTGEWPGD
ncbi:DUF4235 domain-containing protein [Nesterenkonia sp. CF4.4]|uniref:DUF4235 domain-containing protein n=1 Tax=Nesterenkonia sp. CF4.4 TaxID=3373079 RepID=UPI003EE63F84